MIFLLISQYATTPFNNPQELMSTNLTNPFNYRNQNYNWELIREQTAYQNIEKQQSAKKNKIMF